MAINILTKRHSRETADDYKRYIVKCPCCKTILSFGKDDVFKDEDDMCIHHEYITCPSCNEEIQLNDDEFFGY